MASDDETGARERNREAWNAGRYAAWVAANGAPADAAKLLIADPRHALRRLLPHLGDVRGKRICNVQGSHGRIAVSLALLGADVTVIDFAEENRRYAVELAAAAGVAIDYRLCDSAEAGQLGLSFDAVVMELGILHYHHDLGRFFAAMRAIARPGATLVVNEFHPVSRKLYWAAGPHDYFASAPVVADVPNPVGDGRRLGTCEYRFWTLGEIVNAVIGAGFAIARLDEHPDWTDAHIPGTFTLVGHAAGATP